MLKFNRFVAASAAALMLAGIVGVNSPVHADTTPTTPIDPTTFQSIEVTVVADTPIYWGPDRGDMITTGDMLRAGQQWYVLGQDATGKWVEVEITPFQNVWVPKANFPLRGVALPILSDE
jgi:hypothetical protein